MCWYAQYLQYLTDNDTYYNICTDVDECAEGTSGCSQECNNTIGSFECSCIDGYQLAFNGKACNGIYMGVSLPTSNMCAHTTEKKHTE